MTITFLRGRGDFFRNHVRGPGMLFFKSSPEIQNKCTKNAPAAISHSRKYYFVHISCPSYSPFALRWKTLIRYLYRPIIGIFMKILLFFINQLVATNYPIKMATDIFFFVAFIFSSFLVFVSTRHISRLSANKNMKRVDLATRCTPNG